MYVKVLTATLSEALYQEINTRLTDGETYKIYYRKCRVTEFGAFSQKSEFTIDNLFPSNNKLPDRIYFVLVSAKSKEGHQKTNPLAWFAARVDKILL